MFHDEKQNEQHYDQVLRSKPSLYYERFDADILEKRPIVRDLMEKAFATLFPRKVDSILDLGCGTGFYFPILAKHTHRLIGVDVCEPMLEQAQKTIDFCGLSHCRVLKCSAYNIPVEDQSIDVVHSWDFLHHVSDLSQVFAEIKRVLKTGGRYVAIEPNLLNPSIAWYHARRRSEWRLFIQNQFTMRRQLKCAFDIRLRYDNTIISFLSEPTYWIWKSVDRLTSIAPFRSLAFRYVMDCQKRPA
jgi:ubiquinone/menaquinone biosynthesis C-methylase UbiE